ncbi:uncharacterized protein LOC122511979 isoform X1 [Leptopilina heterotoma]|uniref:uncharacterized protein LOC122511979 isoform X1 n=2 Tax=Leptopilina heterotoma TaxID=63436 RepID=UPI001CA825FE|nr:uncharacterized protein LOC122511979 isoform X1 [Leptopilina heterotoma]
MNKEFYERILHQFGQHTLNEIKNWIKLNYRIARRKNQRKFLYVCKNLCILPDHIVNNTFLNFRFFSKSCCDGLETNTQFFGRKILKLELSDISSEIKYLYKNLHFFNIKILQLTNNDFFTFLKKQVYLNLNKYQIKLKNSSKLKIEKLKSQQIIKIKTNQNWIENLTPLNIPKNVSDILALGGNFGFPYSSKQIPIPTIISNVEYGIRNIPSDTKNTIRGNISYWLQNLILNKTTFNCTQVNLINKINETKKFLNSNKNIVVTTADKCNKTVIITKNDYISKTLNLLTDTTTYKKLNSDPTISIQNCLRNLLKSFLNKKYFEKNTYKFLNCTNGVAPKFYGLPKLHKNNIPMRPITSFIGNPIYNLSKLIANILKKSLNTENNHYIKDSWDFKNKLNNIFIPPNFTIFSLDVVSMYTNISWTLINNTIKSKWSEIEKHTNFSQDDFLEALNLCLNSAYCQFQGEFYKQIFGLPMGSPISSSAANIVMEGIEDKILNKIKYKIIFYFRYIDDILICAPSNKVDDILCRFNSIDKHLKFTLELSNNNKINFLDLSLSIDSNNFIETNWFRKSIWTGRYMNFYSHHPLSYKIGIIYTLVDRAIKLSDQQFHLENLNIVKKTLLLNGYPIDLLNRKISQRYNALTNNLHRKINNNNFPIEKIISIPYIQNFDEIFFNIFKQHKFKLVFTNSNNLKNCIFPKFKDPTEKFQRVGCVYKIQCKDCDSCYIGETLRHLKTRIKEHKRYVTHNQNINALTNHTFDNKHSFDFDNTNILQIEINNWKRKNLEMFYIKNNTNSINYRTDIDNLDKIYYNLITYFKT